MDQIGLTVRELIAALEALPENEKDHRVGCFAEAGCTWTPVYGITEKRYNQDGAIHVLLDGS